MNKEKENGPITFKDVVQVIVAGTVFVAFMIAFVWCMLYFVVFMLHEVGQYLPNPMALAECHWGNNPEHWCNRV
jgi:hypothetical protein